MLMYSESGFISNVPSGNTNLLMLCKLVLILFFSSVLISLYLVISFPYILSCKLDKGIKSKFISLLKSNEVILSYCLPVIVCVNCFFIFVFVAFNIETYPFVLSFNV